MCLTINSVGGGSKTYLRLVPGSNHGGVEGGEETHVDRVVPCHLDRYSRLLHVRHPIIPANRPTRPDSRSMRRPPPPQIKQKQRKQHWTRAILLLAAVTRQDIYLHYLTISAPHQRHGKVHTNLHIKGGWDRWGALSRGHPQGRSRVLFQVQTQPRILSIHSQSTRGNQRRIQGT